MAIPDFFGQQQSSLRSGMQLGEALRFNPLREQAMKQQMQNEELLSPLRQQQMQQNIQAQQQQMDILAKDDLRKDLTQSAVTLMSFDKVDRDQLMPQFVNKFESIVPGFGDMAAKFIGMDQKEQDIQLLTILNGLTGKSPQKEGRSLSEVEKNFQTMSLLEDNLSKATETQDEDLMQGAQKQLENFKRLTNKFGATEEEKARIAAEKAGNVETAKGISKRMQGFIDSGIDAADSVANIKRSLQLLDSVKTGGIDNASLMAKRLFGIESADEAELSAGLGKSILAQLKPIFGAAFTAQEGERLEKIEANFGKSTEGNKRLLDQVLKITDRAARRGLRAAEKAGDDFTYDEIQGALDFTLEPLDFTSIEAQTVNPAGTNTGRFKIEVIE